MSFDRLRMIGEEEDGWKRKSPLWRQAFLRALKRTGNVRASAFEAGVDLGTAYDHRVKDAGFAAKWGEAKAAYDLMAAKKPNGAPRPFGVAQGSLRSGRTRGGTVGEELVLRRTKHGDKLVRAAAGRWCSRIEESFLDGLEETGCVRSAARAAGISTAALYARREHYPEFAARWDERAGRAGTQLPGLLNTAAVASLSPSSGAEKGPRRGRARLPKIDVDQAIRLVAIEAKREIEANRQARAGARRGQARPVETMVSFEEGFAALERELDALDARERPKRLAQGWIEAEDGTLIPPGWVRAAPPEAGAGEGETGTG
jgi:hypothetical protein